MVPSLRPYLVAGLLVCLSSGAVAQAVEDGVTPKFVASVSCAGCHQDATAKWRISHHALAWRVPDDKSVLGDFADARFEHRGVITRFSRHEGGFFIETDDREGRPRKFQVIGTAGAAPLQQYLVATEPGRIQALDVAWDDRDKRWYHLYPDLDLGPRDGLHWTGPYKNWNARCAECHATGFEKNYEPLSRSYASTQAEIGVGCEACHGPGEAHLAWADNPSTFDGTAWRGIDPRGLTIAFRAEDPEAEIQQCASCHSRREPLASNSPIPGTPFHDAYRLALLRPGLYHPDGQILDEVYVYGSFLQSRMYASGVRCSNCHEPHAGALRASGNALCTQCHGPAGNADFPSLKRTDYDTPAHHFHEAGSESSQCKSCHMGERVYMGIDGRRDHSFRIPRPGLSVSLGTPNVCTDCHPEQSAAWAAAEVAARFPKSTRRGAHFSTAFAAAWSGSTRPKTVTLLVEVALARSLPGIVRASALDALTWYASPEIAERTEALLQDGDPLIRAAAIPLQRPASPEMRLQRVVPLLEDALKAVRIEAARALLDLYSIRFPPKAAASAQSAMREHRQALTAKADFPEGQMAIAGTALTLRDFTQAETAFAEAVRMDPQMVDAWIMIARLRAAQDDGAGAIEALRGGLGFNPDSVQMLQFLRDIENSKDAE